MSVAACSIWGRSFSQICGMTRSSIWCCIAFSCDSPKSLCPNEIISGRKMMMSSSHGATMFVVTASPVEKIVYMFLYLCSFANFMPSSLIFLTELTTLVSFSPERLARLASVSCCMPCCNESANSSIPRFQFFCTDDTNTGRRILLTACEKDAWSPEQATWTSCIELSCRAARASAMTCGT